MQDQGKSQKSKAEAPYGLPPDIWAILKQIPSDRYESADVIIYSGQVKTEEVHVEFPQPDGAAA